jgi:hypothetical protein
MGKQVLNKSFGFPKNSTLPEFSIVVLHVIVGDKAFKLYKHEAYDEAQYNES